MVVRNTPLIVLFAILLSHSVIAQTSEETNSPIITSDTTSISTTVSTTGTSITSIPTTTTTTTPPIATTPCQDPDDFPLFGSGSCISRELYTGIFLTSIILAGISFLMLIGLLILYCTRHSGSSDSSYISDDESSISNSRSHRESSIAETPPVTRRGGQSSDVLKKVTGTTPLEQPTQTRVPQSSSNNKFAIPTTQVPLSTSSAPYTATKPVSKQTTRTEQTAITQPKHIRQKQPESLEMTARETNKQSNHTSRTQATANQGSRNGKSHNHDDSSDDNEMTSQF